MDRKEAVLRIKNHMEHHGIGKYPHLKLKEALDMAIAALSPPNEPLTLEELLRMDGAPVWLDVAGGMWALVDALDGCLWLDRGGSIDIAKFAGKAYRRPPEGEA